MSSTFYHAHEVVADRCLGRMKCLRVCPTQAVRLRKGKVTFLTDLCIDCGRCLNICPQHVFVPVIDELARFHVFKYRVAVPSPVLYTQFGLDVPPSAVRRALKAVGFDEVVDLTRITKEMQFALIRYLSQNPGPRPLISSFCPSAIRLIQVRYPNLVQHIDPIDVPRELVAKEIKQTYPQKLGLKTEEIGIIFITPCPAKAISIKQPAEKERSWIDGVMSIWSIFEVLFHEVMEIQKSPRVDTQPEPESPVFSGWCASGYVTHSLGPERSLAVAGLNSVKRIYDDIENSKLEGIDFVEVLACAQGCVGGAYCVENPYIARHKFILLDKDLGTLPPVDQDKVRQRYERRYYFLDHPILPRPSMTYGHDIAASIKRMKQKERIILKLPQKDCGLCGAPTCETFAEDCARNEADISDCAFFSDKFRKP